MEFDLDRYGQPPLVDFLMGRQPAGRLYRALMMLPMESATKAMVRAEARTEGDSATAPAWMSHYGDEPTISVLRDIWNVIASTNAGKKKPKPYPLPPRETQKRPTRRST